MITARTIILSLITISGIYSQNSYDAIRPFWGFNCSQIVSNGIGGATAASGYITPGLTSNPANLAATPFAYFQTNLSNVEFNNSSSNISKTGFNGIDFVQLSIESSSATSTLTLCDRSGYWIQKSGLVIAAQ